MRRAKKNKSIKALNNNTFNINFNGTSIDSIMPIICIIIGVIIGCLLVMPCSEKSILMRTIISSLFKLSILFTS